MHRLIPPLCLLMALAMAVVGFGLWAVDAPEPPTELHRAAAEGDDQYRDALEAQLRREQLRRKLLLGCLFVGCGVFVVAAFLAMRPAESGDTRS